MIERKNLEVGQVIFAYPTGNNKPRTKSVELRKFKIVSLARDYMSVVNAEDGSKNPYERELHIKSGSTRRERAAGYGGNAGYLFYYTEEDYIKSKLVSDMFNEFSYCYSRPNWLSEETVDMMLKDYMKKGKAE